MKRLTLIRHAKSSWADPALPDHDRPLAGRGRRDGDWLAATLPGHLPEPDRVLSSTASRAIATAGFLQQAWPSLSLQTSRRCYLAPADVLLALLQKQPDDCQHIVLVGHHPGLSRLACQLAPALRLWLPEKGDAAEADEATLVTAGVVSLTGSFAHWRDVVDGSMAAELLMNPRDGVIFSRQQPPRFDAMRERLVRDLAEVATVVELNREPAADDVHFLRTRIKRLRAGLRLLQPLLGALEWTAHDRELQALARRYAPLREWDVQQQLVPLHPLKLSRHRLWQRQLPATVCTGALTQLQALQTRLQALPAAARADRQVLADIARSYRRTRRAFRHAALTNSDHNLHQTRMWLKRLLMQLDLIADSLPVQRAWRRMQKLADCLGQQHDRALLLATVPAAATESRATLDQEHEQLTVRALRLGDKLFADKHPRWLHQLLQQALPQ